MLSLRARDSAGNDGESNDNPEYTRYPASYDLDNIIAVAITDADDNLSFNSKSQSRHTILTCGFGP